MRLHNIVLSTIVAALLCGCGSEVREESAPVQPKTAEQAATEPFESMLPGDDVEKLLFKREAGKEVEVKVKEQANRLLEQKLTRQLAERENAHDLDGTVRAELKLGDFYLAKRRAHDAREAYLQAAKLAEGLENGNSLVVRASVKLGESLMRLNKHQNALNCFERAGEALNGPNEFGETPSRIAVRKAWALHCLDQDKEAKQILAVAKRDAEKKDKDTSAYRIALLEEAVLAMDAGNKTRAGEVSKQLAAMPEVSVKDGSFGKIFLRVCAKNCRKRGQPEQEDLLDEASEYWADAEKRGAKQAAKQP